MEWTCKPNSVPFAFARGEDHSSVTRVAAVIEQPTRTLITGTGGPITSLFGLAPQGVYRAVAAHAGRGALLPHRFTLASSPALRPRRSAVCFLLHFPSRCRAWPLASLLPVRVRTFLRPPTSSGRRSSDPLHTCQSNRAFLMKIACDKLLLFQTLTINVGWPT